jgi:hypothetical protein
LLLLGCDHLPDTTAQRPYDVPSYRDFQIHPLSLVLDVQEEGGSLLHISINSAGDVALAGEHVKTLDVAMRERLCQVVSESRFFELPPTVPAQIEYITGHASPTITTVTLGPYSHAVAHISATDGGPGQAHAEKVLEAQHRERITLLHRGVVECVREIVNSERAAQCYADVGEAREGCCG